MGRNGIETETEIFTDNDPCDGRVEDEAEDQDEAVEADDDHLLPGPEDDR